MRGCVYNSLKTRGKLSHVVKQGKRRGKSVETFFVINVKSWVGRGRGKNRGATTEPFTSSPPSLPFDSTSIRVHVFLDRKFQGGELTYEDYENLSLSRADGTFRREKKIDD